MASFFNLPSSMAALRSFNSHPAAAAIRGSKQHDTPNGIEYPFVHGQTVFGKLQDVLLIGGKEKLKGGSLDDLSEGMPEDPKDSLTSLPVSFLKSTETSSNANLRSAAAAITGGSSAWDVPVNKSKTTAVAAANRNLALIITSSIN
jgi:hypothetical protein